MNRVISVAAGVVLCMIMTMAGITACSSDTDTKPEPEITVFHDPWLVVETKDLPKVRDWRLYRGIVHSHSPYSHDACDDDPFPDGSRNEPCFEDVRRGMCQTAQDFVFLSDHKDLYADHEYPDVLLYAEGDSLIERNGEPVANRVACEGGRQVVVSAGTESEMMPIGLEHHVGSTPEERKAWYSRADAEAITAFHDAGALAFLQHTEGWDIETILDLPIDGIEIYNMHQNLMTNMGAAFGLILLLEATPEVVPEMELAIAAVFRENDVDITKWAQTVAVKPVSCILATDVHQNALKGESPDGERIDSFRRLMHWFSNYVLIDPKIVADDATFKEAIGKGRMYGAFDYLGYPAGFDFYARAADDTVYEMGQQIPAADGITLHVSKPAVYHVNPDGEQPEIRVILLKAEGDGWVEVASGSDDITHSIQSAGVYRAEVRMKPYHLRQWLGSEPEQYLNEVIWIYSNPIYVGMNYRKR